MEINTANASAFGTLLRKNPKADAAYENSSSQQKQELLLRIAAAAPENLPKIVSELEKTGR